MIAQLVLEERHFVVRENRLLSANDTSKYIGGIVSTIDTTPALRRLLVSPYS